MLDIHMMKTSKILVTCTTTIILTKVPYNSSLNLILYHRENLVTSTPYNIIGENVVIGTKLSPIVLQG